ncbi:Eco57I restriction-modification methylase domain-containing protein [Parafrankia sp. FMc2]|uniref:Eco57I restriction-modification methylase domain-containing protein n=1 Tax=Parafrankia sp. FMc2 TaxID=3233196 RepID=UPI0034D56CC8
MSGLSGFKSVRLTGSVIPADALTRAADGTLPGQQPTDYGLVGALTVNAAAARAWDVLLPAHQAWKKGLAKIAGAPATGYTRDRWLLPLFYELGYGRPTPLRAGIDLPPGLGESTPAHFPVSHQLFWPPAGTGNPTAALAIHLLGPDIDLDHKTPGVTARAPHAMIQELLNRSPAHLWAILSNGSALRVLRDTSSLARQSYLEYDLDLIFDNQLYADFRLLFTVLHASRLTPRETSTTGTDTDTSDVQPAGADGEEDAEVIADTGPSGPRADDCWIEQWRSSAIHDGARALDALREGVAAALTNLGTGFVAHPANSELVAALASSEGALHDFHRWLLRIAYRLIVTFVAEDRDLLHPTDCDPAARARYEQHFSTDRLRRLAATRTGSRHGDLWEAHRLVTDALGGDGNPLLALPGLAASLYEPDAIGLLRTAQLSNRHLLAAVRTLSQVTDKQTGASRPIDYRNLDSEELGSVYEGLLAYVPRYDPAARTFVLEETAGNERKKSGSYYTPSDLIALVLDEALDPLIDAALRAAAPEAALLDLTVCDPACGSGHFLVAAARRIAKALAAVRTGDPEPPPEHVRTALRDVVSRCVYGVDLNDLAVEIAKVALWLETLERGKPLAFLDAHLKVGNALLGTTPKLLRGNIPDTAFTILDGDDRDWTNKLRRRNKTERERPPQDTLFDISALGLPTVGLTKRLADIEAQPDRSLDDVRARADAWRRFAADPELHAARRVADAWCAAFVQPKTRDAGPGITHDTVQQLQDNPEGVSPHTAALIDTLARDYRFFHWHLEFPGIFTVPEPGTTDADPATGWVGGFSCLLGNPPWERVKIQEKEWFAAAGRDDIAKAANAAKRRQAIAALADEDPDLAARYHAAQRRAAATAQYLLGSGRHPLTGRGDINTFSVFAETFRTLISADGSAGVVTPTGLATDKTTSAFFGDLVATRALAAFHDFVTNPRIWTDVGNRRFRFAVSAIRGPAAPVEHVRMSFFSKYPTDVTTDRVFTITPHEIQLLNPNTGNCPVFITRADADLTIAAYRRHPILIRDDDPSGNPWGLAFLRMFDMSNDSRLFHRRQELQATADDGWEIRTTAAARYVPLYEAKLLWHYDHRLSSYALRAPTSRDTELPRLNDEMHDNPDVEAGPLYWVSTEDVQERLAEKWDRAWLLGWRDITRADDARTMISCALPTAGVGHKFPLVLPAAPSRAYLLHALFSSIAFDYVARQKMSGIDMTYTILKQIAAPHPDVFDRPTPWDREHTLAEWIRPYVLELSYSSKRLRPYAQELGDHGEPFRWRPHRRAILQADLDAAFLHIYGFQPADTEHILSTFRTLASAEKKTYSEYRTRRLVLDAYTRMATAAVTGFPWRTAADIPAGQGPRHSAPL